jgi:hypothetical protein
MKHGKPCQEIKVTCAILRQAGKLACQPFEQEIFLGETRNVTGAEDIFS